MTKTNPLTRKAGPFPVWAWAALVLVAGYLYYTHNAQASGGAQLPFTPASTGSAAQQPASGQGSPADNGNSDLLDALGNNLASSDALLAALQSGGQGGGYGSVGGTGGTTTGDTSATTAPTVTASPDPGTQGTDVWGNIIGDTPVVVPTASEAADPLGTQQQINQTMVLVNSAQAGDKAAQAQLAAMPAPAPNDPLYASWELGQGLVQTAAPDALDRYLANNGVGLTSYVNQPVTQPTPTVVQPAPVDTSGVITPTPRPTPGHAVAV